MVFWQFLFGIQITRLFFWKFFLVMFTGFCWFFWSCPWDSAWFSESVWLKSRWFSDFFWWCLLDPAVNLQHSGLDLLAFLCICITLSPCLCHLKPLSLPLALVMVLALALWSIWMTLTRGTGWPPGLCVPCSRRSLGTGLARMAGAMCTPLVSAHMLFWRAGCAGSYLFFARLFFSFLHMCFTYFCVFFFLVGICFFSLGPAQDGAVSGLWRTWLPVGVDLCALLAELCLWASVPVHWWWNELSECGCCAEESGAGLDSVSWLASVIVWKFYMVNRIYKV